MVDAWTLGVLWALGFSELFRCRVLVYGRRLHWNIRCESHKPYIKCYYFARTPSHLPRSNTLNPAAPYHPGPKMPQAFRPLIFEPLSPNLMFGSHEALMIFKDGIRPEWEADWVALASKTVRQKPFLPCGMQT